MKKSGKSIAFLFCVLLMCTSCTLIFGGKGNNGNGSNGQNGTNLPDADGNINYNFKLSKFPYDSVGLKIWVQSKTDGKNNPTKELGTITSAAKDACVQGSVKLPAKIDEDSFYIFFVTSYDSAKYYYSVRKDLVYDAARDLYDIYGWYNCYYSDERSVYSPVCGAGEANIIEVEFEKLYEFNFKQRPYYLFSITGKKDKTILFTKASVQNADLYYSTDMEKILSLWTHENTRISNSELTCPADVVYFMIRPDHWDTSTDYVSTYNITFNDKEAIIEKCLEIKDKFCFASDGKLYATDYIYSKKLYSVDIATCVKTLVKDFENDNISYIGQIQPGTLLVSTSTYKNEMLHKINLTTKEMTSEKIDSYITGIAPYKDNKYIAFATEKIYMLDSDANIVQEIQRLPNFYSIHGSVSDVYYIADKDLFIYSQNTIPSDLYFLGIEENQGALKYYTWDSKYHGSDYEFNYNFDVPDRLFSTSPLQFITSAGQIYDIDADLILSTNRNIDNSSNAWSTYTTSVQDWCLLNKDIQGKPYEDCYISGDYIYYMYNDFSPSKCHVEKCSLASPLEVLDSLEIDRQKGKRFFLDGNKLKLIANSSSSVTGSYYRLYIHEIDF